MTLSFFMFTPVSVGDPAEFWLWAFRTWGKAANFALRSCPFLWVCDAHMHGTTISVVTSEKTRARKIRSSCEGTVDLYETIAFLKWSVVFSVEQSDPLFLWEKNVENVNILVLLSKYWSRFSFQNDAIVKWNNRFKGLATKSSPLK